MIKMINKKLQYNCLLKVTSLLFFLAISSSIYSQDPLSIDQDGNITIEGDLRVNGSMHFMNDTTITTTFLGYRAGFDNKSNGSYNTAIGFESFRLNTTGEENTAIGFRSLYSNITGKHNTTVGTGSLYHNTSGESNTAIGNHALLHNTTGKFNTAIGRQSLSSNTRGENNTAIGYLSLLRNTTGENNTAIGKNAFESGKTYSNSTAIGYNTQITASNQVRIGNFDITSIGATQGWSTTSDARFKTNVKENVKGLDFILDLRPVTYTMNISKLNALIGVEGTDEAAIEAKSVIVETGFLAQEVEKSAQKLGYDFSGVDSPKNDNDYYSLRYAAFTVPLVKAVQELHAKNQQLELENETMRTELEIIKSKVNKLEALYR
jgi:hypothetical protein